MGWSRGLKNFGCPRDYRMRFFKRLHMSWIVLLAGVQTALPPTKESINLFCLLLISVRLNADVMFMFLILLCVTECMTADGRALWLGMGEMNQWRIYNPRTRRLHVSASVWSNEGFSYYDTSH